MRPVLRRVLLVIGGLASLFAIAILCRFAYAQKLHIEVIEVRATSEPQAVLVTWFLRCEDEYFEDDHNYRYLPNIPLGARSHLSVAWRNPGQGFCLSDIHTRN